MVLARKVSGDYGLHNTWAWNSDHLLRPLGIHREINKGAKKNQKTLLGKQEILQETTLESQGSKIKD